MYLFLENRVNLRMQDLGEHFSELPTTYDQK